MSDILFIIMAISSLIMAILFIVLCINVWQIKSQVSDKRLFKEYSVQLHLGNKEKALEYLQRYYYSRQFENKLSDEEKTKIYGLIQVLKSDN